MKKKQVIIGAKVLTGLSVCGFIGGMVFILALSEAPALRFDSSYEYIGNRTYSVNTFIGVSFSSEVNTFRVYDQIKTSCKDCTIGQLDSVAKTNAQRLVKKYAYLDSVITNYNETHFPYVNFKSSTYPR